MSQFELTFVESKFFQFFFPPGGPNPCDRRYQNKWVECMQELMEQVANKKTLLLFCRKNFFPVGLLTAFSFDFFVIVTPCFFLQVHDLQIAKKFQKHLRPKQRHFVQVQIEYLPVDAKENGQHFEPGCAVGVGLQSCLSKTKNRE